jgi:hypothetical protein
MYRKNINMKKLITAIILLSSLQNFGQSVDSINSGDGALSTMGILGGTLLWHNDDTGELSWEAPDIVKSKYDTTVLFEGKHNTYETFICVHDWAIEKKPEGNYNQVCAIMHGAAGCSNYWMNQNKICTNCLRHINIKETRWTEPKEQPKDRYKEALEKLNKLKGSK